MNTSVDRFATVDTSALAAFAQLGASVDRFATVDTSALAAFAQLGASVDRFATVDTSALAAFAQLGASVDRFATVDTSALAAFAQLGASVDRFASMDDASSSEVMSVTSSRGSFRAFVAPEEMDGLRRDIGALPELIEVLVEVAEASLRHDASVATTATAIEIRVRDFISSYFEAARRDERKAYIAISLEIAAVLLAALNLYLYLSAGPPRP